MVSIHFYSLGREGQVGAAPSVLLPPDIEPIPLEEALDTVRNTGRTGLWREATWTMLRGTPHPPFGERDSEYALRYPAVLRNFCDDLDPAFPLDEFDEYRDTYRHEARLLAAALISFALGARGAFTALRRAIDRRAKKDGGKRFADALQKTGALAGSDSAAFLGFIGGLSRAPRGPNGTKPSAQARCIDSLRRLENEVGVNLETYIGEFADTVAFMEIWDATYPQRKKGHQDATVYPAFTVAVQDTRRLTTMVTSTSLVTADSLRPVTGGVDPLNWCRLSQAFREVHYVRPEVHPVGAIGTSHDWTELREVVHVTSQAGGSDMGFFDNLLWVRFDVRKDANPKKGYADLDFTLRKSIRSRLLWDERPGGLLVDGGWTKVRSIAPGLWRVTARKVLRFEDRTPESSRDGPLDFGQALNYLAPSALSAWLECDIYSGEDPEHPVPDLNAEAAA